MRFIGRRDRAPEDLQERMAKLERETKRNDRLSLWIAFDYGGRAELVEAARRLVAAGVDPRTWTRTCSRAQLTRRRCPTRISLIRTSGELRISNFLLWQLAYSELVFVTRSGPTSVPASSATRSGRTRAAAAGSAVVAACSRKPVRRDSSAMRLWTPSNRFPIVAIETA